MTVERIDRAALPGITREKLNPFLEEWYNRGAGEADVRAVQFSLRPARSMSFPCSSSRARSMPRRIKPETIRAVNEMVEERLKRPLTDAENSAETPLDRLGLDSLERMDLALQIEDRFGFRSDRVAETLGELWALAEGQLSGGGSKIEPPPPAWNVPPSSNDEPAVLGDTIAEAFVRRVLKTPDDVSTADRISGVLSYRKLYVAAS